MVCSRPTPRFAAAWVGARREPLGRAGLPAMALGFLVEHGQVAGRLLELADDLADVVEPERRRAALAAFLQDGFQQVEDGVDRDLAGRRLGTALVRVALIAQAMQSRWHDLGPFGQAETSAEPFRVD